jgi:hypothetical protein
LSKPAVERDPLVISQSGEVHSQVSRAIGPHALALRPHRQFLSRKNETKFQWAYRFETPRQANSRAAMAQIYEPAFDRFSSLG